MPTVKLTAKKLDSLKPSGNVQVDYFDGSLPGFSVRVSPAGRKTFTVMYRYAGKLRRLTIGRYPPLTLAGARDRAKEALREASKGLSDPATKKRQDRMGETFEDLCKEYLERHAKRKKRSWREDERRVNNVLVPKFGKARAKDITRAEIRAFLEKRVADAPIETNRLLALIRKVFNWAIENDILESSPCHRVPMPAEERQRDRVLSEDEIKKLWKALDEEDFSIAATFKLRLITAQRGGEVHTMKWTDMDFTTKWWTIPGELSKNGLPHRVPLSAAALRILEQLKKKDGGESEWIFQSHGDSGHLEYAQNAVVRLRKETGMDFRAHDLRRSAASHMASMGIPRLTIQKILNHVEKGVTAVYDRHGYDREKREALEAWGSKLQVIVSDLREVKAQKVNE